MNKQNIVTFFDSLAASWDAAIIKEARKINQILDIAGARSKTNVLDVSCGTDVLLSDYIARNVKKCVAIDISPRMVEIARKKFCAHTNIEILCADAETLHSGEKFDCIVIYNTFPHLEYAVDFLTNIVFSDPAADNRIALVQYDTLACA